MSISDGIEIKFNLTNEGKFDTIINFNNQTEASYELFGLFLSSLEQEQNLIYNALIKKLREMLLEDDNLIEPINSIFTYKAQIDKNVSTIVIKPSQVFINKK